MINRLKKFTLKYRDIHISILILLLAFIISFTYEVSGKQNEDTADGYQVEYPNGYKKGYGLYIDGSLVTAGESLVEIRKLFDESISSIVNREYGQVYSFSLLNNVYFTEGTFSLEFFLEEENISSNIDCDSLAFEISVLESEPAEVEAGTVYMDNTELPEGEVRVISEGETGTYNNIFIAKYIDGENTERELMSQEVITEAVPTVIERGIMLENESQLLSIAMFIMPYKGSISSEYGGRILLGKSFHGGVDIVSSVQGKSCYGDDISAAGDGYVVTARYSGNFGNLVILEHSNGVRTYYAHMSKISVKEGDTVRCGDKLGEIGSTGLVTGPHLHFEVRLPDGNNNYYYVDPKYYIENYEIYLR